jgi:hypothetical protein
MESENSKKTAKTNLTLAPSIDKINLLIDLSAIS